MYRTLIHWQATVNSNHVVITDSKWSISKLVFVLASESRGDITLDILAQLLPAEVGLCGRPALNVLWGLAHLVESLSVALVVATLRVVLIDPVRPEAAHF